MASLEQTNPQRGSITVAPAAKTKPTDPPETMTGEIEVRCNAPNCRTLHWGAYGAAGILLIHRDAHPDGAARTRVLLQHRGLETDHGGTWALPGGALDLAETPVDGAIREASEEAGLPLECTEGDDPLVKVRKQITTMDHGSWRYTTVIAEVRRPWEPSIPFGDAESLAMEWIAVEDVVNRRLHPGFKTAWYQLRTHIEGNGVGLDAADRS